MTEKREDFVRYYDENYGDYAAGWSPDHMHYGFWLPGTNDHEESLVNTVKEIIKELDISTRDTVLDAGSGSGGTCRYIARHTGARVTGINLSPVLHGQALLLSENLPDKERPRFELMDFTDTAFPDGSFSRVLALESVCHTPDKNDFVREAFRLLQKGGRLLVSDFFLTDKKMTEDEKEMLNQWLRGWAMPNLAGIEEFKIMLARAGFRDLQHHDKTELIYKSSSLMHDGAKETLPAALLRYQKGEVPQSYLLHTVALARQKECLDAGLWRYFFFTAGR
jgi:cyclopropane fatty-acyl-phospholipid synthase-like methyltransferase